MLCDPPQADLDAGDEAGEENLMSQNPVAQGSHTPRSDLPSGAGVLPFLPWVLESGLWSAGQALFSLQLVTGLLSKATREVLTDPPHETGRWAQA